MNENFLEEWSREQFNNFQMCCGLIDNINYVKKRMDRITSLRKFCFEAIKNENVKVFSSGVVELAEDYSENNFYYIFNLRHSKNEIISIKYDLSTQKHSFIKSNEVQWDNICNMNEKDCCPYFEGHNPIIALYSRFKINKNNEVQTKELCVLFE